MTAVVALLSAGEAQRLTQRIKLVAGTVRDNLFKLRNLVDEAKSSNVWSLLGFESWTAYLADTLGSEPMRLGREERRELVEYLSGEGMSTRAIAGTIGVSKNTVTADIREVSQIGTPAEPVSTAPEAGDPTDLDLMRELPARDDDWTPGVAVNTATGEVVEPTVIEHTITEKVKAVTGLDGKTYPTAPTTPKRRSLVDDAYKANTELWKAIERVRAIRADDRFTRNKADILAALQPGADLATEVLQDLFK